MKHKYMYILLVVGLAVPLLQYSNSKLYSRTAHAHQNATVDNISDGGVTPSIIRFTLPPFAVATRGATKPPAAPKKTLKNKGVPNGRCKNCFKWKFPVVITPDKERINDKTPDKSGKIDVLLIVPSIHENGNHRAVFREIYNPQQYQNHTLRMIFLFGRHPKKNETLEGALKEEAKVHGDLLQTDVVGTYWNMTRIIYNAYAWVRESSPGVKFIIKITDDVLLNMAGIFHLLDTKGSTELADVLFGSCINRAVPKRGPPSHKWYMSWHTYPYRFYPAYCSGAGFMVSAGLMNQLLDEVGNMAFPNPHDDLSVGFNLKLTGHCVCDVPGFTLFYYRGPQFRDAAAAATNGSCVSIQKLGHFMGVHLHGISPQDIRMFWTKRHCYEQQIPHAKIAGLRCRHKGQCADDNYHIEPLD